jgi:hypothetical protein
MAKEGRLPRASTRPNNSSPVTPLPRPQFSSEDMAFIKDEIRERESYLVGDVTLVFNPSIRHACGACVYSSMSIVQVDMCV